MTRDRRRLLERLALRDVNSLPASIALKKNLMASVQLSPI